MAGAAPPQGRVPVLGVAIDRLDLVQTVQRIAALAEAGNGGHVCLCNAHSAVTAGSDAGLARALASAALVAPDGASVACLMRWLGADGQRRVAGPDLMAAYCEHAAAHAEPIYLYGSTPATLAALQQRLLARWPKLRIAGAHSPPYRALSADEQAEDVARIQASGARTVWVGLGCPKQEQWMASNSPQLNAVLIGVGAAFDFHAGTQQRAPLWLQRLGLEWLHRLCQEPRRLGPRYLVTNTRFILAAMAQLLAQTRGARR
jgi:N-acetylglucosaminyldiphosphoundecaprenol N-acetyl-beta-D-mannosaminyltransferase